MLKHTLRLRPTCCLTALQVKSLLHSPAQPKQTQTKATVKKWDLFSAVYLERHPIIIKPMADIEKRYMEMLQAIEYERSYLSDHELRQQADAEFEDRKAKMINIEEVGQQTAQDFEDAAKAELKSFKLAPTITESDKSGDLKSLDRKLDTSLVLLTKHSYTEPVFIPPQGPRLEGETMRQAAERVLIEACGPDLKVKFYGNMPVGFYKYSYPRSMRQSGNYGAKVFYYLAKYISGQPQGKDYLWLDRQELAKKLPGNVHKCVSKFRVET